MKTMRIAWLVFGVFLKREHRIRTVLACEQKAPQGNGSRVQGGIKPQCLLILGSCSFLICWLIALAVEQSQAEVRIGGIGLLCNQSLESFETLLQVATLGIGQAQALLQLLLL